MILSKIKEICLLYFIYWKVKIKNIIENTKVIFKYYRNTQFLKIDLTLLSYYLFKNPFKMSKNFLIKRKTSEIHTYGETPLTTIDRIAEKCNISKQDVFYELGCGRGRLCFWFACFVGCKVVGIEYIPDFIIIAEKVQNRYKVKNLSFKCENLFFADLQDATFLYLYGLCYTSNEIRKVIELLEKLPKGVKVITVSYSLKDYQPNTTYRIIDTFSATFNWGVTEIIVQEKMKE